MSLDGRPNNYFNSDHEVLLTSLFHCCWATAERKGEKKKCTFMPAVVCVCDPSINNLSAATAAAAAPPVV